MTRIYDFLLFRMIFESSPFGSQGVDCRSLRKERRQRVHLVAEARTFQRLIQYFQREDEVLREAVRRAYVPVAGDDITTESAPIAHTSVVGYPSLEV